MTRVFVARLAALSVFDPLGDPVGRVRDVVVHFSSGRPAPRVLGLVVEVPGRRRGTKTRRRPGTSTTRPRTRGAGRPELKCTTTSRTRPTGSPSGSKTLSAARRATKTRVMGLTPQG